MAASGSCLRRQRHWRLLAAAWAGLGCATPGIAGEIGSAPGPMPSSAAAVMASGDAGGQAFAIIDKRAATISVFDGHGAPIGSAPVLLGMARGDATVPGIGNRPLAAILPSERTTPAGRFAAVMGTNAAGHDVLWVDYDAAISIHAVVTSNPAERRLARLASPTADDNRISFGCINVPAGFFQQVIGPTFSRDGGTVYVLPEEAQPAVQQIALWTGTRR